MIKWIIVSICITGAILNARQRIEGFYFWIIANIALMIINYNAKDYQQSFLFLFYFCLCIYGIVKWRKK